MNDRAAYANADARFLPLADGSVHMIATSPPYWRLRSYLTGDNKHAELGTEKLHDCLAWARGEEPCGACYVCNLRTWAAEMWRVLRSDGVMFVNLGDSYAGGGNGGGGSFAKNNNRAARLGVDKNKAASQGPRGAVGGLKPKELAGIPWRTALALQADGWRLRRDVIWEKGNCMPERVKDRPTTSHEYIFLLTKRPQYYWDAVAVREPGAENVRPGGKAAYTAGGSATHGKGSSTFHQMVGASGRNRRSVWTVNTTPYAGAHYATWPPALVEIMVKAGTSERGVCPVCGKPWRRVVEREGRSKTVGESWRPACAHDDAIPVPAVVLDPFCGSGTTLQVARQLGRIGLGFDLSETYLRENAAVRLGHDKLAAWGRGITDDGVHTGSLFASAGAAQPASFS